MRYVVYGAGAVGGVVGGNLHRAGVQVTLVARGEHRAAIQRNGLVLETPVGAERLRVPIAAGAGEVTWTGDTVVLFAVKSQQTVAALDDLGAHGPRDIPIVSFQNGVANEATILRRFERTYGVCVMLPSGHVDPGRVVQHCHPTPGILDIGRYPGSIDETAEAVAADLRASGFESVPRPDIMAWKHRKLLLNLGNAVQATCRPGPAADELVERSRAEGERVLEASGVPVVTVAQDRERRGDTLRSGERHPRVSGGSTWQSLARGTGDVETDYLSGEIVLLGRLHGVPTPVNELLQATAHMLALSRGPVASLDAADLLDRLPK